MNWLPFAWNSLQNQMNNMGEIRHLEDGKRGSFAYFVDGKLLAEMVYIMYSAKRMIIEHTEVDESLKGQNIGKKLLESIRNLGCLKRQRFNIGR